MGDTANRLIGGRYRHLKVFGKVCFGAVLRFQRRFGLAMSPRGRGIRINAIFNCIEEYRQSPKFEISLYQVGDVTPATHGKGHSNNNYIRGIIYGNSRNRN